MPCANGTIVINSLADIVKIISNIARIGIAASGAIAVVALLVASIFYITSAGDPGRTKRAKDIIFYTIIGLLIIILGYAAITFVTAAL